MIESLKELLAITDGMKSSEGRGLAVGSLLLALSDIYKWPITDNTKILIVAAFLGYCFSRGMTKKDTEIQK